MGTFFAFTSSRKQNSILVKIAYNVTIDRLILLFSAHVCGLEGQTDENKIFIDEYIPFGDSLCLYDFRISKILI